MLKLPWKIETRGRDAIKVFVHEGLRCLIGRDDDMILNAHKARTESRLKPKIVISLLETDAASSPDWDLSCFSKLDELRALGLSGQDSAGNTGAVPEQGVIAMMNMPPINCWSDRLML